MFASSLIWFPPLVLALLLGAAVWHDVRSRRIPNRLVFAGALLGLAVNALVPAAPGGLFGEPFGGLGLLGALAGFGLGLAILMPMYLLRAMGAGDVKLLAMVGAFVGPQAVLGAALFTLVSGGVLALAVAAASGSLRKVTGNTYHMLLNSMLRGLSGANADISQPSAPTGKLPYAVAIAVGSVLYLIYARHYTLGLF